jgi:hypothetical protein
VEAQRLKGTLIPIHATRPFVSRLTKDFSVLPPFQVRALKIDPGCSGSIGRVLKRLRAIQGVTAKQSQVLAQGYARCLQNRGFGIALHTTDAEGLRKQIFDAAGRLYRSRLKNPAVAQHIAGAR